MNNTIVIKNINDITPYEADTNLSKKEKLTLVNRYINPTKYTLHGFLDRTNEAVLQARYHNVRDRKGRFARVARSR
jgi:hypothetical protein